MGLEKLPAETLASIFSIYITRKPEKSFERLLLLMQVCKRWLEVISDARTLWTSIDFNQHPDAVKTMLLRSATVPITLAGQWRVACRPNKDKGSSYIFAENNIFHRIKSLRINLPTTLTNKRHAVDLTRFLSSEMPLLERFDFESNDPQAKYKLPRKLFSGKKPSNLREIALKTCSVSKKILPLLINLSVLDFTSVSRLYYVHLAAILRSSPNLIELSLDCSLPSDYPPPSVSEHSIPLNHLTTLRVVEHKNLHSINLFLARLIAPNVRSIQIIGRPGAIQEVDELFALSMLYLRNCSRASQGVVKHLSILTSERHPVFPLSCMIFTGLTWGNETEATKQHPHRVFSFHILGTDAGRFNHRMECILRSFMFGLRELLRGDVRSLAFDGVHPANGYDSDLRQCWVDILNPALPNVKAIRVNTGAMSLLRCMDIGSRDEHQDIGKDHGGENLVSSESGAGPRTAILFPALKRIITAPRSLDDSVLGAINAARVVKGVPNIEYLPSRSLGLVCLPLFRDD